jgi:hypothetical protein
MSSPRIIKLLIAGASVVSLGVAECTQSCPLREQARTPTESTRNREKSSSAALDVQTLVEFGPRVAGTAATERTSSYLVQQYHQAGYVTSVQTFTYSKFVDQGSHLTVGAERSRVER